MINWHLGRKEMMDKKKYELAKKKLEKQFADAKREREELDGLVGEVNKVFALPGLPDGERKKGTKK